MCRISRLIDADKFLDFIKSELKQDRTDEKHLENIICVLENLPTAFDVDKVVKQLEELKEWEDVDGKAYYTMSEKQVINKAIKIVKVGGIDE